MPEMVRLTALDGTPIEFLDAVRASGGMKDVYFHPARHYAVAFFRETLPPHARDRLEAIAGRYREGVFQQEGGAYWEPLYRWPQHVLEVNGHLGVVVPFYAPEFFFEHGSVNDDFLRIRGREKEGKWFASPGNQVRYLDMRERGDWRNYLRICLLISRAVRRMHSAGLAHSDLSYKNVLIDPVKARACIIDLDGLVVPGKYPPDVVGTPDFIAPEVVATTHLPMGDAGRALPNRHTDLHALAVLIYQYLLLRHPLRGSKVHDSDPHIDETLAMGERALFIEHPDDGTNRIHIDELREFERPWRDTSALPYTITGPHLAPLFERAFIHALHTPTARPGADEWEHALLRTEDLLLPCDNPACTPRWFVYDNSRTPTCPFCHRPRTGTVPVLNLYTARAGTSFKPDNHRLAVYDGLTLHRWHVDKSVVPNERLDDAGRRPVGRFQRQDGEWHLINDELDGLIVAGENTPVPRGGKVALRDGTQLVVKHAETARLMLVQMAGT